MNILLDTHFLLWQFIEPNKISPSAQSTLLDTQNTIFYSPISLWEIAIKFQLGKLDIKGITPEEFLLEVKQSYLEQLVLDDSDLVSFYNLPKLHNDPFDRLLIWQAIKHNLTFMSVDSNNSLYQSYGLTFIK